MIDYETFCRLRQLYDEAGLKVSQIATELQLDPKTVERWVNQKSYQQRQGTKRVSKLDSFKQQITALLARHPYTAQQILQQLREQGYAGGYSILKEFVRHVRPPRKPAYLNAPKSIGATSGPSRSGTRAGA
jgi:transposase